MAGKLLYSRVLQNRAIKNQTSESSPLAEKATQKFYTSQNEDMSMDYPKYDNRPTHNNRGEPKGDGNKIRRGPGRRIDKEKKVHNMDPALMNKYSSLPEALQEKVNATIEIYYQQYKANSYKNAAQTSSQSHYDDDVVIDREIDVI